MLDKHSLYPPREPLTRAQKWRTAIILIEIVVLLTAVLLNTLQVADTRDDVGAVQSAQAVVVLENTVTVHPITVYVDMSYTVHVIEDGLWRESARLQACPNRYIDVTFEGALHNYRSAPIFDYPNAIHAVTFDATGYEMISSENAVTIRLPDGASYTLSLHCNSRFDAAQTDNQSQSDALDASLNKMEYEYGSGCPGEQFH